MGNMYFLTKHASYNYKNYSSVVLMFNTDPSLNQVHKPTILRRFPVELKLPEPLIPRTRLLLYYVTSDGEAVSDAITIQAKPCLKHKVVIFTYEYITQNFTTQNSYTTPSTSNLKLSVSKYTLLLQFFLVLWVRGKESTST